MASLPNASMPIKTIVITGGTHGNETNGILLAQYFEDLLEMKPFPTDPIWANYRSIDSIRVIYSNPKAIQNNTRYVDEDLNRCFLASELDRCTQANDKLLSKEDLSYERERAAELNEMLGPKGSETNTDLIIDLHTTTANTGINLIMSPMDQVCASNLHQWGRTGSRVGIVL